jgi:hypothetical protein
MTLSCDFLHALNDRSIGQQCYVSNIKTDSQGFNNTAVIDSKLVNDSFWRAVRDD